MTLCWKSPRKVWSLGEADSYVRERVTALERDSLEGNALDVEDCLWRYTGPCEHNTTDGLIVLPPNHRNKTAELVWGKVATVLICVRTNIEQDCSKQFSFYIYSVHCIFLFSYHQVFTGYFQRYYISNFNTWISVRTTSILIKNKGLKIWIQRTSFGFISVGFQQNWYAQCIKPPAVALNKAEVGLPCAVPQEAAQMSLVSTIQGHLLSIPVAQTPRGSHLFCLLLNYAFIKCKYLLQKRNYAHKQELSTCKHVSINKRASTIRCVCAHFLNILFFFSVF